LLGDNGGRSIAVAVTPAPRSEATTDVAEIHPSAIVNGDVELAAGVVVGAGCVLSGPISIGAGSRLIANVHVHGPLSMGERNVAYPFACFGFAPQSRGYDPDLPGRGAEIGNDNVFREGFTVHRASLEAAPTRIGSRGFFMVNSHVAHDCDVGDDCTLANGALLGGHVRLGDGVVLGGNSAVHQHCRIGRGAMLSGAMATSRDLPPWFLLTGMNIAASINAVGLRRSGLSADEIADVKWVHRTLSARRLTRPELLAVLAERDGRPMIAEYIRFIEESRRGICSTRPEERRSKR
jgi:UDP-N-acetylglucosamine acyltransferase